MLLADIGHCYCFCFCFKSLNSQKIRALFDYDDDYKI